MNSPTNPQKKAIWLAGSSNGLRLFFAQLKLQAECIEPTANDSRSLWIIHGGTFAVDRVESGFLIWEWANSESVEDVPLRALYADLVSQIASKTGGIATGIGPYTQNSGMKSRPGWLRVLSIFPAFWKLCFGRPVTAFDDYPGRNDGGFSGAFVPVKPKAPNEGASANERTERPPAEDL